MMVCTVILHLFCLGGAKNDFGAAFEPYNGEEKPWVPRDGRLWRESKDKIKINKEKKVKKRGQERSVGLETGGTVSECESGVLPVTGALRLHDTWHVSSPAVSRSPATVLQLWMVHLHTEIEITMCSNERNYAEPEATTWTACENRLESSRFASDLSVSLMQRRPQIHYKPIICAGPGLGTHSWTAVLNPQRGANRKFENRIHTWVTLEGFGWINELSGSLSTCWGAQSFTS